MDYRRFRTPLSKQAAKRLFATSPQSTTTTNATRTISQISSNCTTTKVMRIYKSDGSFVDTPNDTEFGWKIDHITNQIEEFRAESTIETLLPPEGVQIDRKFYQIDDEKHRVAGLIQPYGVEEKILLAVVHYAKYKQLINRRCEVNFEHLRNHSAIKFLIDTIKNDSDLEAEIRRYDETKENNVLSLMMEIILTDLKCDLNDLKNCPTINNSNEEAIYSNIEKICEETSDIRAKIDEIRTSFREDQSRVEALIGQAQSLEKSLRETNFLDELLHFLNGDLDKITPKKCPFKILLGPITDFSDINLII